MQYIDDIIRYRVAQRIAYGRMARLNDYLDDLQRRGYRDYYQADDADACWRTTCGDCGHIGMKYIGMKGRSYVAIIQCPECHWWREF